MVVMLIADMFGGQIWALSMQITKMMQPFLENQNLTKGTSHILHRLTKQGLSKLNSVRPS